MPEAGFWLGLDTGFFCEKGDRKEANEDAILIKTCVFANAEWGIFLVADGVGGMNCGDVASGIVAETLAHWWDTEFMGILSGSFDIDYVSGSLDAAIFKANDSVRDFARECGKSIGTTMSLLLLMGDVAIIRHIGDSRIYLFGKYSEKPRQLTEDHTYVSEQIKKGLLTPKEVLNHPNRNVITKCIGSNIRPDLYSSCEMTGIEDSFLLCSDGFYNIAHDRDVARIVQYSPKLTAGEKAAALRRLVGRGEAYDNISAILVTRVKRRAGSL